MVFNSRQPVLRLQCLKDDDRVVANVPSIVVALLTVHTNDQPYAKQLLLPYMQQMIVLNLKVLYTSPHPEITIPFVRQFTFSIAMLHPLDMAIVVAFFICIFDQMSYWTITFIVHATRDFL